MTLQDRLQLDANARVPLVVQLTDQITWLIASDVLEEGELLPSIRDLAEAVGVHMHTVRQAYHRLEEGGLVSIRRRRGTVVQAIDPLIIARNQHELRSFLLGVMLPAPVVVYQPFLEAVHQASTESEWMPLIVYTGDESQVADRCLHQLLARGVDGLIIVSNPQTHDLSQAKIRKQFPPIVYVDAPHVMRDCLLPDTEGAAFRSTTHLLDHGYERVAMITPPLHWDNVLPCLAGYQRALECHGLDFNQELVHEVPNFSRTSGYRAALKLLEQSTKPRAAFIAADELALGAMKACEELGLGIPGDFAISSYNDIDQAALVTPALTTAQLPAFELGLRAVGLIKERMEHRLAEGGQITLKTPLVIRQSCGC